MEPHDLQQLVPVIYMQQIKKIYYITLILTIKNLANVIRENI